MQFEDASRELGELGFLAFSGNDHTVELPSGASCGHKYYCYDFRDAGRVLVDLLAPQEGVAYDAASQTFIELWNVAQHARAKEQVTALRELQAVLAWCP